uniref:Uncharacterized protein n=1 Tax=Setaria italica TaxID=4555 RepID=K3YK30_SETIT
MDRPALARFGPNDQALAAVVVAPQRRRMARFLATTGEEGIKKGWGLGRSEGGSQCSARGGVRAAGGAAGEERRPTATDALPCRRGEKRGGRRGSAWGGVRAARARRCSARVRKGGQWCHAWGGLEERGRSDGRSSGRGVATAE